MSAPRPNGLPSSVRPAQTSPPAASSSSRPSTPASPPPARPARSARRGPTESLAFSSTSSRPAPAPPAPSKKQSGGGDSQQLTETQQYRAAAALQAFASAGRSRKGSEGQGGSQGGSGRRERTEIDYRPTADDLSDPMFGEINGVLRKIKQEWTYVMDPDFNPVTLALSLLDSSSAGQADAMPSFLRTKKELERALQGTVNTHYQAFNASISTHSSFLSLLSSSSQSISSTRSTLLSARESLGSRRADLVQLHAKSARLKEGLRVLDQIEALKAVPEQLENLITEKRLLLAVMLLVRSLKVCGKQEMMEVGAVADLRAFLNGQETALREILIEELHNHLYLKSLYCDVRWVPYIPGQDSLPTPASDSLPPSPTPSAPPLLAPTATLHPPPSPLSPSPTPPPPATPQAPLTRYLNSLSLRPSKDPLLDADASSAPPSPSVPSSPAPGPPSPSPSGSFPNLALLGPTSSVAQQQQAQHPESDSFAYIETLLESLAALNRLPDALDTVVQRLPTELHALVEATVEEVAARSEGYAQAGTAVGAAVRPSAARVGEGLGPKGEEAGAETMRDLFWTVFAKLDAVMQGHRVVHEVARRIGMRRQFGDGRGVTYPLVEVWKPVQAEVRSLLNDYLTDDSRGASSARNLIASVNDVLRDGGLARDRQKSLFKFADTDPRSSSKALKQHEDALSRVLLASLPGLVSSTTNPSDSPFAASSLSAVLSDSGTANPSSSSRGYRLLAPPDAFNIPVLFQPTHAFLRRARETLPGAANADEEGELGAWLDEFVDKAFLPQLQEKVTELFNRAVAGADAFVEESVRESGQGRPIVKSVFGLIDLIGYLSEMLRSTPFHREAYSRLIISVIVQYYQRCSERFLDLVRFEPTELDGQQHPPQSQAQEQNGTASPAGVLAPPDLKLAAKWAQRPEITVCLSELLATPATDVDAKRARCAQESRVELGINDAERVKRADLVSSNKKIVSLGNLYQSLKWFTARLESLKTASEQLLSPTSEDGPGSAPDRRPVSPPSTSTGAADLPLTRDMVIPFEALLKTYHQFTDMLLFTLRLEVRCRTIHFLDLASREGNYQIEEEAAEPDPSIADLNAELNELDEAAASTLTEDERRFLFEGLGLLMDQMLVASSRTIRFASRPGAHKMLRNILALQQNLKTIVDTPLGVDFVRSRRFWEMFLREPKDWLEEIRVSRPLYSFDEYESLLKLQCGIDQSKDAVLSAGGGGGAGAMSDKQRRAFNENLIMLHQLVLDDDWD